ncbi:hypothetical protein [Zooshikella ganghwensis]|uniref:DUF559 domain-containing protein n=1 Tax=Zooshikella ganghwensis TaxID=202772 RepID=A0A4P9VEE1_9GAMM|nr:hypothetical protein [Zooshikella ganghwensis]RDH41428.1 hypothetical protein B9G39_28640 [Zooshikella ganghwensis]
MSKLEATLELHIRCMKLPKPETEYKFHPSRCWRFDFAWPDRKLAVEVDGGGWSNGRHTRGAGFAEDMRKYNAALIMGWRVYRCDAKLIKSGQAVDEVGELLRD